MGVMRARRCCREREGDRTSELGHKKICHHSKVSPYEEVELSAVWIRPQQVQPSITMKSPRMPSAADGSRPRLASDSRSPPGPWP